MGDERFDLEMLRASDHRDRRGFLRVGATTVEGHQEMANLYAAPTQTNSEPVFRIFLTWSLVDGSRRRRPFPAATTSKECTEQRAVNAFK